MPLLVGRPEGHRPESRPEAADLADLGRFRGALRALALAHKDTLCVGRSHGIHAEPMVFGLKPALWYAEAGRNIERLERAKEAVRVGKISGAIGTFAHVDPDVEEEVCRLLGLEPDPISTQVVQRDRHAELCCVLAVIAAESAFQSDAVSPRNARGLMQLMPDTAQRFGVNDVFDAGENIRGGAKYLRWLLTYFEGDLSLTLAAYNAGEGAVTRYGGIPPFPETRAYVQKVRALYTPDRHAIERFALR